MSQRQNIGILTGSALSISLIAVSLAVLLLSGYYQRSYTQVLGKLCREIIEEQPEAEGAVLSALKECTDEPAVPFDERIILSYGYRRADFVRSAGKYGLLFGAAGSLAGGLMILIPFFVWRKKETLRIEKLTDYLEKVNTGRCGVLFSVEEGAFSKLQDEIYKTVTELHQTRDGALQARNDFAANLYNIAHQIKTPITSISLSAQMMRERSDSKHLQQISQQLSRLTYLEEALLLLSRIDAGVLAMERKETDVFTVLMLAADNLQELFLESGVSVHIPESEGAVIYADLEWTMEAIMNLLKNCMEHTPPGGCVSCSYEQNPLYTQIRIWDDGMGFAEEDIPHLFERFYRGQGAKKGGIGIGLVLAKEIIESQNGTITARNLADHGACFEICFYPL